MVMAAGMLVTLPVFLQAPLVKFAPWLSLVLTVGWLSLSRQWQNQWGSLLWGFALSWLCGSLYWGWLSHAPLWHLPIEACALPWALWGIDREQYRVGSLFYLGSLVGTCVTDVYFWLTGLIPAWQQIVALDPNSLELTLVFQEAWYKIQTPWGLGLGVFLATGLLWLALMVMQRPLPDRYAFGGAVMFTLLTDSLFGIGVFFLAFSNQSI